MPQERQQETQPRSSTPPLGLLLRLGRAGAIRAAGAVGTLFTPPAGAVPIAIVVLILLSSVFLLGFAPGAPGVPEVPGTPILQPTLPPGVASDCPVPGGKISTYPYQASQVDPKKRHCTPEYTLESRCRTDCPGGIGESRRAKAIDVPTNGQNVRLPTIQGQEVTWELINIYSIAQEDGGGSGYTFEAIVGSDKWYLDMLHLGSTILEKGKEYSSGTPVARSVISHVHVTMGRNNINRPLSPGWEVTDCDSGWRPTDPICQ